MRPWRRFAARCDREFVVGEDYPLAEASDRSGATHNHYFASLHDLFLSLPPHLISRFPTEDRLRKHALCMCGYRVERSYACGSPEEARKLAAFIEPLDEFAVVGIHDCAVVHWSPLSQSRAAMGKARFQDSKKAVLEWIEDMLMNERQVAA